MRKLNSGRGALPFKLRAIPVIAAWMAGAGALSLPGIASAQPAPLASNGGLQLCGTDSKGKAIGPDGADHTVTLECKEASPQFALKTNGNANGTGDPTLAASRILGYQDRIEINTNQLNVRAPSTFYYDVNLNDNKITKLKNGTEDQDAVNVGQLRGILTALGGGAAIDKDGAIHAPTYIIGNENFHDVGAALIGVNNILTQGLKDITSLTAQVAKNTQDIGKLQQGGGGGGGGGKDSGNKDEDSGNKGEDSGNKGKGSGNIGWGVRNGPDGSMTVGNDSTASGKNASAFGQGAQATAKDSVALGQGSVADRPNTVSVGSKDHERIISNVAPGVQGTDAANMDQLNAVLKDTDNRLLDLDRNTRRGIAAAAVLQSVTPYLPGRAVVSVNGATYRGQQAVGLGLSYWSPKGNVNFNAAAGHARGPNTVVRVGLAFTLGQ